MIHDHPGTSILMERCGITAYYDGDASRIRPVMALKRSPQDFIVHEVRLDGTVCDAGPDYLDDSLRPVMVSPPIPFTTDDLINLGIDSFDAERIVDLPTTNTDTSSVTLSGTLTKEERTAVHAFFKPHRAFVTDCPEPGKLRVSLRSKYTQNASSQERNSGGRPYDRRNVQDPNTHPHVQFVLTKRSLDTMEAVSMVAKAVGGRAVRDFSFAGTKDRRAVTHQQVVLKHANPQRLLGVNKVLSGDGDDGERMVKVSCLRKADKQLSLGDLSGNRFNIALYYSTEEETIPHIADNQLFLNYFGLQRFGTHAVPTDAIGAAMLRQDYQLACSLIIPCRFTDLRAAYDRGDYEQAMAVCPRFLHSERALLEHLSVKPNDFEGALLKVPRETRMLYCHAWQSLIFNKSLSDRIRRSRDVLVGDLVETGHGDIITVDHENVNTFTMLDVVLPLPGYKVTPSYADSDDDDGVTFTPKNPSMYDLPGCYRKIIARADNLQVSTLEQGVNLQFTLPPSSYATMFLREHFTVE